MAEIEESRPRWIGDKFNSRNRIPIIDPEDVKQIVDEYNYLSFPLKKSFLNENIDLIKMICNYAPWYLLENHMLFFLHAVSIIGGIDIFPRKMRQHNRFIVIDQMLKFIEARYITFDILIRKIGNPRLPRYAVPHVLKFLEFNMKIPNFLIDILRPANFKQYKFDARNYYCRRRISPSLQSHWDLKKRLNDPKNQINEKYIELLTILETSILSFQDPRIKKRIQSFIDRARKSLFFRKQSWIDSTI